MTPESGRDRAWLVTSGQYSNYHVLAVALSEEEAQRFADEYNAQIGLYRDEAEVGDCYLYREGGALPKRVAYWNGQGERTWQYEEVVIGEPEPPRVVQGPVVPSAYGYPTEEAARDALKGHSS